MRSSTHETVHLDSHMILPKTDYSTQPLKSMFGVNTWEHTFDWDTKIVHDVYSSNAEIIPKEVVGPIKQKITRMYKKMKPSLRFLSNELNIKDYEGSEDDEDCESTFHEWKSVVLSKEFVDSSESENNGASGEAEFLTELQNDFEKKNPTLIPPLKQELTKVEDTQDVIVSSNDRGEAIITNDAFVAGYESYTNQVRDEWGRSTVTRMTSPQISEVHQSITCEKVSTASTLCFWMCCLKYATLIEGMRASMYTKQTSKQDFGNSAESIHSIFSSCVLSFNTACIVPTHACDLEPLLNHESFVSVALTGYVFTSVLSGFLGILSEDMNSNVNPFSQSITNYNQR